MSTTRKIKRNRKSARHERLKQMLVQARTDRSLTQVEVAKMLGKPQSFVSKYESGDRHLDLIDLLALCAALECSAAAIVSELEAMED